MSHEIKYSKNTEDSSRANAMPEPAVINNRAYWYIAGTSAILVFILMTALPVKAQGYDGRDYQQQNNSRVTVYENCDFGGRSRDISVGDYQDVRELGLGNDRISSIRVPNGFEIEVFEDERFRGGSAIISRDVPCLNSQWNNQASSLRVSFSERRQYDGDASNGGRYNNRHDDYDRENQDQRRDENSRNNGHQGGNERHDFTTNVSRVEFAQFALLKGQGNRWNMSNHNGPNQSYTEINRDNRVIYLRNYRSRKLLELDVYSSNASVISANGRRVDYQITRIAKGLGSSARAPTLTPNSNNSGSFGVVNGSCFTYKAYARGGRGGIKFQDKDIKQQFDDDAVTGRVCHSGSLIMELNKVDPDVDVFVEIQGRTYKFTKGEKEDVLLNTWYRKMVKLKVSA